MHFNIQAILENDRLVLLPLGEDDFDALYAVAADPDIWRQHPNKDRWRREIFRTFFEGALQSKGAYKIIDKATGDIIGSTRFYDYNEQENSILIGYTFYATRFWGEGINHAVKTMMLGYILRHVDKVYFHIGAENIRSQIAISRLGVTKIAEQEITYFGESPKMNFIYELKREDWERYKGK